MSGSQLLLLGGTPQVASDPNFEYTTLLLPGNGTNGAQNNTFLDSSTNNFTITRNGNTTQGTFSPFSQTGWGNYFDGSGDYLTVADNAALQMGSGDFTIEYWWYPNNITSYQNPIDKGYTGAGGLLLQTGNGDGRIIVYASGSAVVTSSTAVTANAWNHMALVRSGTTLTLYQNGASVGSATNSTNFNSTAPLGIGATATAPGGGGVGSFPIVGFLSGVRFVKGTAVYSGSTYTVPTAPLTVITNTSLLTCQSNRFIDNSTNAFAITRNGDVSVQPFSPFNPTTPYSTSAVGGSGYFDGSGDYLRLTYSSALQFTGNFTIEFWAYPLTQVNSNSGIFSNYGSWPSSTGVSIFCGHSAAGATKWNVALFGTFPAIQTSADYIKNAWSHIALVRNGTGSNNITLYVNGVASGTFTSNNTVTGTSDFWWVGTTGDILTQSFTGYLTDFRVAGSAVYTSNFTPPTAPLTAITNTSLLLNYTNAGIYDATSKNDLETVGNAQISTTQSKFGGSSMYFDGTGDYLLSNAATTNLYAFGTGDFTVECWAYATSLPGSAVIFIDFRPTGTEGFYPAIYFNSGVLTYFTNSADRIVGPTLAVNTWYHIALCRVASQTKMFLNGTQVGATYSDTNNYICGSQRPAFATWGKTLGSNNYTGYINDLRISKGIGRYTANFTAPTAAFPLL